MDAFSHMPPHLHTSTSPSPSTASNTQSSLDDASSSQPEPIPTTLPDLQPSPRPPSPSSHVSTLPAAAAAATQPTNIIQPSSASSSSLPPFLPLLPLPPPRPLPFAFSDMVHAPPAPPRSPPPRMVDPVSVLPLLDCLHCHALVNNPVTLFCGHTLCASHITPRPRPVQPHPLTLQQIAAQHVPSAAPPSDHHRQPTPPTTRSRPTSPPIPFCPLATCTLHNPLFTPPPGANVPVAYAAPRPSSIILPDIRTDPRISNITALVVRALADLDRHPQPQQHQHQQLSLLPHPAEHDQLHSDDNESVIIGCTTNTDPELGPRRSSASHPSSSLSLSSNRRLPILLDSRSRPSTPPPRPPPIAAAHPPPDSPPPRKKRRKTEQYGTLDPRTTTIAPAAAAKLERELLELLTCGICYTLLYEPITTPCQHVSRVVLPCHAHTTVTRLIITLPPL